jgi:hypothetical protein
MFWGWFFIPKGHFVNFQSQSPTVLGLWANLRIEITPAAFAVNVLTLELLFCALLWCSKLLGKIYLINEDEDIKYEEKFKVYKLTYDNC